jgi:hypothetical protein
MTAAVYTPAPAFDGAYRYQASLLSERRDIVLLQTGCDGGRHIAFASCWNPGQRDGAECNASGATATAFRCRRSIRKCEPSISRRHATIRLRQDFPKVLERNGAAKRETCARACIAAPLALCIAEKHFCQETLSSICLYLALRGIRRCHALSQFWNRTAPPRENLETIFRIGCAQQNNAAMHFSVKSDAAFRGLPDCKG